MSETPILELKGLKRTFTQGHKTLSVLNGIDLTLQPGEMIGLVGASGSGKSTLLQCAGLLDQPTDGLVVISGSIMSGANDKDRTRTRREHLGFIYQFHHLLPEFSALENVALAASIAGATEAEATHTASELLEELGLSDRQDHIPAKLSGGEQQRVAIARALASKPSLLLADEPTGNLDQDTAERVFELFVSAVRQRNLSALVATHDMALAKRMDRQYQLKSGVLQASE